MSLEKIISIPGMSGLFKMVAQLRNGGYVVESFADQKRIPISTRQRISMLKDISVFTTDGEMPLNDVFLKMKEHNDLCAAVGPQADAASLRSTLKKILPEFDDERVHDSDIKKMFNWYTLLKDQITKEEDDVAVTAATETSGSTTEMKTEKHDVATETVKSKPKTKKTVKKED